MIMTTTTMMIAILIKMTVTVTGALIIGQPVAARARAGERTVGVLADSQTQVTTTIRCLATLVHVCVQHPASE